MFFGELVAWSYQLVRLQWKLVGLGYRWRLLGSTGWRHLLTMLSVSGRAGRRWVSIRCSLHLLGRGVDQKGADEDDVGVDFFPAQDRETADSESRVLRACGCGGARQLVHAPGPLTSTR